MVRDSALVGLSKNARAGDSLRIAQVHSNNVGGGAEAVARLHHDQLRKMHFDANLWVARKSGDEAGVMEIPYVRGPVGSRRLARWIESRTGGQYLYSPSFRALLRGLPNRADVVHLHSLHGAGGYAELQPLMELSRRLPCVMTIHDLWLATGHCSLPMDCTRWLTGCGNCPDLNRYPSIPRDGTRWNWQRKRRVFSESKIHLVVPTRWVESQVQQSPILAHLPTSIVFNPLDTSVFSPGSQVEARQRLGLREDGMLILVVAQNLGSVFKGFSEAIEAMNRLDLPDARLLAIGSNAEPLLKQSRGDVTVVPYQAEQKFLTDYYRAADLLLMPSKTETFGMVAAEAMACGTPVVAFAAGGLVDVIGDDEGGLLVPQGDVHGLVTAMRRLLGDADLRSAMGHSASARSARLFGLETHSRHCLDIYQDLLRNHTAPLH